MRPWTSARVQIEVDAVDRPRRPEPHCDAAERHETLASVRRCRERDGRGSAAHEVPEKPLRIACQASRFRRIVDRSFLRWLHLLANWSDYGS